MIADNHNQLQFSVNIRVSRGKLNDKHHKN